MLTEDTLFDGRLVIYQEREGYRFSLDAVLLAGLTRIKPRDRVVELGTGCGVISLMLAYRCRGATIVGIELQHELASLARKNVEVNGLTDRVRIAEMDYRHVAGSLHAGEWDTVLSNPPYRRLSSGRINAHPQRAQARHELTGSVAEVFAAGRHLLAAGGRLAIIYPATRLGHLLVTAHQYGFSPKVLTLIHSDRAGPARLVHLECRKGGGEELLVPPPFFIYEENGEYSDAMRLLYEV